MNDRELMPPSTSPLRFLGPHENLYRTPPTRRTNLAGGGAFEVAIKAPTGA